MDALASPEVHFSRASFTMLMNTGTAWYLHKFPEHGWPSEQQTPFPHSHQHKSDTLTAEGGKKGTDTPPTPVEQRHRDFIMGRYKQCHAHMVAVPTYAVEFCRSQ